jgi:RNA polymerase sigma-70 factor (ECF subfamily)
VEQADLLQHALGNLDEKLRAIFLLREVEGMSYEEIAAVLEIPTGTVGSQLNRARVELRDSLTKAMNE